MHLKNTHALPPPPPCVSSLSSTFSFSSSSRRSSLPTWYHDVVYTPFFWRTNAHTRATVRRKTSRTSVDPRSAAAAAATTIPRRILPLVYELLMPSITMPAINRWCIDASWLDEIEERKKRDCYEKSHERRRSVALGNRAPTRFSGGLCACDAATRRENKVCTINCILWIQLECTHGTRGGFVLSWISVYSSGYDVHKEDRNAPGYTSLHSCKYSLARASLVTERARDDCSARVCAYVSPETWNEISIRFHSGTLCRWKAIVAALQSPKDSRIAPEPVGHYYLCHVRAGFTPLKQIGQSLDVRSQKRVYSIDNQICIREKIIFLFYQCVCMCARTENFWQLQKSALLCACD